MLIKLVGAVIFVKDIKAACRFYTEVLDQKIDVDFGANVGFVGGLSLWQRDHATQVIFQRPAAEHEPHHDHAELYFETDLLDEVYKRLEEERVEFIHASVGTGALIEQYIEGRELYVGVMGNGHVHVLPVWELIMDKLPDDARRIATERVKWSRTYQAKYGIRSGEARNLPEGKAEEIQHLAKRVYRALGLSGYARIDVRMDAEGNVYVLEANPNPQIAHDEDFSDSAEKAGYSYKDLLQELLNIGLRWRPAKVA
jgi:catechol 2,3-dioxygenase-like lactoylglutathione lyase family enzyme